LVWYDSHCRYHIVFFNAFQQMLLLNAKLGEGQDFSRTLPKGHVFFEEKAVLY
jgi:hypothetical protein